MMRSLYSGVSGLRTHQTKMDVIGNNISNVNTVGFKASSVIFKDILYQTTQNASGANPTTGTGGTNAKQIGLGTSLATISITRTPGSAQTTNNPYDLMLEGNSFFIVNRGGINYYTKVGAFDVDAAGNLVTGAGDLVMGWQVDPANPSQILRDTVSPLRPESIENKTASPEMTSFMNMIGNIDKNDERLKDGVGVPTDVSIYDNLGYSYNIRFRIKEDLANTTDDERAYTVTIDYIRDSEAEEDIYTNDGDPNNDKYDVVWGNGGPGAVTIRFNAETGAFASVFPNIGQTSNNPNWEKTAPITIEAKTGSAEVFGKDIEIDFSALTMYDGKGESNPQTHKGNKQKEGTGRAVGKLDDISIGTDGKIYGVYSNGVTRLLGQLAVANFVNPAGLEAIGGSLFKETRNSGEFDGIGEDVTAGGGKMTQGVLEMSNVDLSQEFTEMIVTQRGFQANSRIITVSDTLIEELVNLKR